MTDPTTPYAGLTKPTVGADSGSWGGLLNGDLDLIDTFLRNIVPPGVSFDYRGSVGSGAPTGFLFEDGSAVSRTTYAALFVAIGTTYGAGDGSTTFNLPDSRSKVSIGAGSTYALAATGGATSFTPTITVTISGTAITQAQLPSYNLTVTENPHTHGTTENPHTHLTTENPHSHAQDGTTYADKSTGGNPFVATGPSGRNLATPNFDGISETTGSASTGLSIQGAKTNLTINSASTGLTVASAGSGQAHGHTNSAVSNAVPTLPPYLAANKIIKT